eukprot:884970-Pelagomonas_calceolata.AAC.1
MPRLRADGGLAGSGLKLPAKLVANISVAPATASHAPLTLQGCQAALFGWPEVQGGDKPRGSCTMSGALSKTEDVKLKDLGSGGTQDAGQARMRAAKIPAVHENNALVKDCKDKRSEQLRRQMRQIHALRERFLGLNKHLQEFKREYLRKGYAIQWTACMKESTHSKHTNELHEASCLKRSGITMYPGNNIRKKAFTPSLPFSTRVFLRELEQCLLHKASGCVPTEQTPSIGRFFLDKSRKARRRRVLLKLYRPMPCWHLERSLSMQHAPVAELLDVRACLSTQPETEVLRLTRQAFCCLDAQVLGSDLQGTNHVAIDTPERSAYSFNVRALLPNLETRKRSLQEHDSPLAPGCLSPAPSSPGHARFYPSTRQQGAMQCDSCWLQGRQMHEQGVGMMRIAWRQQRA